MLSFLSRALLVGSCGLYSLSSFAMMALPPFYTTRSDIETIMNNPEFVREMGSGRPIMEIKRILEDGRDGYLVKTTNKCEVFVEKIRLHTPHSPVILRPSQYTFKVNKLICL